MRAIRADRLDSLGNYAEVEIDRPEPAPGSLRIRVAAIGIGYVDVLVALGRYQVKPALPHIPGVDAAGTVDAIGEGVDGWRVGDRVMAMVTRGFAEYAVVSAALTVKLPDAVSFEQGTYTDTVMTASQSFTVTTTIAPSCTISATAMAFGTYAGLVLDTSSTVTVTCTSTTPYNVSLNQGLATAATVTSRKMTLSGSNLLAYTLTSDAARAVNWGQTIGTDTVAGTGNGAAQTLTVYGRIAAGQRVTPGSYADTIIATITY